MKPVFRAIGIPLTRFTRTSVFVICVAGLLATTATRVQALSFHPILGVTSSTAGTDLWPVSNLIQGPGVGFDASAPYNRLLGGPVGSWITAAPGGFPSDYIAVAGGPVLTFDLGQNAPLSEISVWNYSTTQANGVKEFSLLFATESDGLGGFGSSIGYNPTFTLSDDDTARQSHAFQQAVNARYVQFTVLDNFFVAPGDGSGGETPGGDRVGLGEVAFAVNQAVGVPDAGSTLALSCLGLLALLWRRGQFLQG